MLHSMLLELYHNGVSEPKGLRIMPLGGYTVDFKEGRIKTGETVSRILFLAERKVAIIYLSGIPACLTGTN